MSNTETVSCWVLTREGHPDRFFGSVYPALSENYPGMETEIAFWKVKA
jgi:hypothetical protein